MTKKQPEPEMTVAPNGTREWRENGKRHRVGAPAVEWADGTREWWLNGKPHRSDGPAVEWVDGEKEWWLNGVRLTEQEFRAQVAKEQVNE